MDRATLTQKNVHVLVDAVKLPGILSLPKEARGCILFAHGSGSSHKSSRNQMVAKFFQDEGFATLLFDLMTEEEDKLDETTRELRFNIPFLAHRLIGAAAWIEQLPETHGLDLGFFGASTGAAAAINAAAEMGAKVRAVVSRGGRPDLAGQSVERVRSPTLLIVGGNDFGVIELNQQAYERLCCEKKLEIISGATHLFEEPGTLEEVGRMASRWFSNYL
jgi:putative phosphoribosyl transferase